MLRPYFSGPSLAGVKRTFHTGGAPEFCLRIMSLPPERRSPAKIILGALFNNIDVNEIPAAFGFLSIILLTVFTITAFPNMSFGGSPVGSDPKSLIIRQLQEEASLNNARQLITVCKAHGDRVCFCTPHPNPMDTGLATFSS